MWFELWPAASTSTLGFNEQELLAEKLGYQARSGFLPVETFMQHIYQLFHGVLSVSQEFWERLLESREEGGDGDEAPSQSLETGVLAALAKNPHPDRSLSSQSW